MVPAHREYRIGDAASARAAASIRAGAQFLVTSDTMEPAAACELGGKLTRLSQECGCEAGARFLMVSILASALGMILFRQAWWRHPILWLAAAVVACFLVAGLGKAIGICRARRELRAALRALRVHYKQQEASLHGMHR